MSEILIKGMEMPRSCFNGVFEHCEHYYNCEVFRKNCNERFIVEYSNKRHPDCPLVELPEHGDLIDRSKLSTTPITDYKLEGHLVVEIEDIENAPTILEASEVKE